MALPTASDNVFPKLIIAEGLAPSNPSAGNQKLFIDSTTHHLNRKDSSGSVVDLEGGIAKGTSFPGTPATNDLFYRTDLGMLAYYDGTRWLTVNRYHLPIPPASTLSATGDYSASNGAAFRAAVWNGVYDLYLVDFYAMTYVASGNTGAAYWTVGLSKETKGAAYSATSIVTASTGTTPDTNAQFTVHTVAINALLGTGYGTLIVALTKTSTPGNLTCSFGVTYRLVLT